MSENNSPVAICESHDQADNAADEVRKDGVDRKNPSILSKPTQGAFRRRSTW